MKSFIIILLILIILIVIRYFLNKTTEIEKKERYKVKILQEEKKYFKLQEEKKICINLLKENNVLLEECLKGSNPIEKSKKFLDENKILLKEIKKYFKLLEKSERRIRFLEEIFGQEVLKEKKFEDEKQNFKEQQEYFEKIELLFNIEEKISNEYNLSLIHI